MCLCAAPVPQRWVSGQGSSSSSMPSDWDVRTQSNEPLSYRRERDLYSVCFPQVPAQNSVCPSGSHGVCHYCHVAPPPPTLLFIEARMHVALITEVIGKNQFSFRQETFVFALRRLAEVWQEGLALEGKAWGGVKRHRGRAAGTTNCMWVYLLNSMFDVKQKGRSKGTIESLLSFIDCIKTTRGRGPSSKAVGCWKFQRHSIWGSECVWVETGRGVSSDIIAL